MVNPNEYYTVTQLIGNKKKGTKGVSDILTAKGYWFLNNAIKTGRIKANNTSAPGKKPRYLIKGSEVIKLEKEITE